MGIWQHRKKKERSDLAIIREKNGNQSSPKGYGYIGREFSFRLHILSLLGNIGEMELAIFITCILENRIAK